MILRKDVRIAQTGRRNTERRLTERKREKDN